MVVKVKLASSSNNAIKPVLLVELVWIKLFLLEVIAKPFEWFLLFIFNATFIVLTPFIIGSNPQIMAQVAPLVVWFGFVFSLLIVVRKAFELELQSSVLATLITHHKLYSFIVCKAFALWLLYALPLVTLMPLLSLMLSFPFDLSLILSVCLLLASPSVLLMMLFSSSLTFLNAGGYVLMVVLSLPLVLPVLVLCSNVLEAFSHNLPILAPVQFLLALALISVVLFPYLITQVIRLSFNP